MLYSTTSRTSWCSRLLKEPTSWLAVVSMMCARASDHATHWSSRQCSSQYGSRMSATLFCSASSCVLSKSPTTGSERRHSSARCSMSTVVTVSLDSHTVPQRETDAGVA